MYMRGRERLGCYVFLVLCCLIDLSFGNYVINVEHKFGGSNSEKRTLSALRAHDQHRHGRSLSAVDIPLGGNGIKGDGLYFAKIGLGTPSKDYYVQVDPGSHLTWVNCAGCKNCLNKSGLEIPMPLYNPNESKTSKKLICGEKQCDHFRDANSEGNSTCKNGEMCPMMAKYGLGSSSGYYVTDTIHLNKATGDLKTMPMDAVITFGCATEVDEHFSNYENAIGGMLGLGLSDYPIIPQLSSAGKVKKTFSQCFDTNGGGIFAIGELEKPQVKSVRYIMDGQVYFTIKMIGVKANKKPLRLSPKTLNPKNGTRAVIDSGTTLGYFDDELYKAIVKEISDARPGLIVKDTPPFKCFTFDGKVDDTFPIFTFRFENKLSLKVHPRDYLAKDKDSASGYCILFQSIAPMGMDVKATQNLFGVMAMGNKLFVYDLEKQTVGWTDYNCSSGVRVKDGQSKDQYLVGSHNLTHILH